MRGCRLIVRSAVVVVSMVGGVSGCGGEGDSLRPVEESTRATYPDDLLFVRGGAGGGIFLLNDAGEFRLGEGGMVTSPLTLRRIAFTRERGEFDERVCIAEVGDVELADEACVIAGTAPAWSADGTRIAYVRDGVWMMAYPDGEVEQVAGPEYDDGGLTWSPDGEHLLIQRVAAPLAVVDVRTREVREIPDLRRIVSATWQPVTGDLTVAVRSGNDHTVVYLREWPAMTDRKLFEVEGTIRDMSWTRDGRYLAYTYDPRLINNDTGGDVDVVDTLGREEIHVFNPATGADQQVTRNKVADFGPAWLARH